MRFASFTVDLDTTHCYREIHGLDEGRPGPDAAYEVGVRRLLDLFAELGVRSTLFVIGRDVGESTHRALLEEAVSAGHELGNHSFSHDYGLRHRHVAEIRRDLRAGHDAISEVSAPVGFRAPGYNVSPSMLRVVSELGYRYDSSVFPCPPYYAAKAAVMTWLAVRGRPSRSAMTLPQTMLCPLLPYRPDATRFWRRSDGGSLPLEIPMCVLPGARFPIIGTSLHLLGRRGFDAILPALRATHRRLIHIEFHAIDFMDADDPGVADLVSHQPDLEVPWERKADLYRHVVRSLQDAYTFAPLADVSDAW